jgi:hypothetical protein
MSTGHLAADGNPDASDAAPKHMNGGHGTTPSDFVRRAKATVSALPSRLDQHIKTSPYTALSAALVVGLGVGIVLSSRIVRSILSGVATVAAVELGRALLRQKLSQPASAK